MITLIITAYKEPKTLEKQLINITRQLSKRNVSAEILVCAPDPGTQEIALNYHKNNPQVKLLKDKGIGKPAALNIAFSEAKNDILILTDGDVEIGEEAISEILKPFKNPKIGAVSGRPISINPRSNIFGFWAYILTEMAHKIRLQRAKEGKYIDCSGYLYAMRGNLVKNIPENTLSDDALISSLIHHKGYQIAYTHEAKVYIKYPDNFKDWNKQKKRSTGGYVQLPDLLVGAGLVPAIPKATSRVTPTEMRSFRQETRGIFQIFKYARNPQEFWWTILLIFARIYLWWLIFWELKIKKTPFVKMWQRVESTKINPN
ncbi:MAG: glycosyltransferase [Patescibacteria group bacterium]|nr:glycosyltransferase [Patescibacteria group bacterium]